MEKLTIPLALSTMAAAVLSVFGFVYLSRMIARVNQECTNLALIGLTLITAGWVAETLWNLLFAFTHYNFRFLDNSFYIFLAPGIICLGWALWNSFRATGNVPIWVVPVIIIIVVEGAVIIRALSKGGIGWFLVLLTATSSIMVIVNLQLVWESLRRGLKLLALLFTLTNILLIIQYGLIRWMIASELSAWLIQLNSILMWGCFAYASWRLSRHVAP